MTTKWMLLSIAGLAGVALAASHVTGADLQPMVVTNLSGNLHVAQGIPCGTAQSDSAITDGRIEITPANGVDVPGGKQFTLTRANITFAPFNVSGSCAGFGDTRHYTNVDVRLGNAVTFTASALGGGAFAVTIPKADFLIYEAAIADGNPETGYKHPSQDVTGTIDFTNSTVQMTVVLATQVKFKEGCVDDHCIINEIDNGTLTTTLSGTIVLPDTDGDGVPDGPDNCRLVPNPDQTPVPTPVITPPPPLTLGSCADHHIGVASAVDVCDNRAVTVTNNAPGTFAIGPNPVTWSGNDGTHPIVTAGQLVTIVDTTPPVFTSVPPDIALNDCKSTNLGVPTATDDCAGAVTFTNNAPPKFLVGPTVVTWTAHDVSGNATNATQTVTVTDTVPPTVSCVATGPPTGHLFIASASDACGAPVIRLGSFVLANGEVVKIQVTGQPGVRLINDVSSNNIRHFQVGKGEDAITATDGSNNVTTAVCR
jgi:hypothetical protein